MIKEWKTLNSLQHCGWGGGIELTQLEVHSLQDNISCAATTRTEIKHRSRLPFRSLAENNFTYN